MGYRRASELGFSKKDTTCLVLSVLVLISIHVVLANVPSSPVKELYFTVEPSDAVIAKDHPVILDCVAGGDPEIKIQWKKNGQHLQPSGDSRRVILNNGSLLISNVVHARSEKSDEGLYQCVASAGHKDVIVSRAAKLQVASLPRFDEQPHDITLFPEQTARFSCSIQAIPPANITWLRDDLPIFVDSTRMTVLPSGALEIDHVESSDQGKYYCNASNTDRHRLSQAGKLSISLDTAQINKISAPQFVATPQDMIVLEGSSVTLDCAANGNPKPRITWLKDGATIDLNDRDGRFYKVGTGNLQIHNVQEADFGDYMCRAENNEDSVDARASLEVQVAPRFVKQPTSRTAYEKEDVELECEIYGRPEPTIQWLKNGELIVESEYFQFSSGYNLRILGLVIADSSIYQCFGTNPAGTIQSSAQLIVLKTDTVTAPTTSSFIDVEQNADVSNRLQDTPSPPLGLTAVIVSTRFVTLAWQPPTQPNGDILAYSVYFRPNSLLRERVVNTTRSRLEEVNIRGLRSGTTYYFRVLAYNKNGPGESSEDIEVTTNPEIHVPNAPQNIQAIATSPTSIEVSWTPPDPNNGPIDHYKLYYMEVGTSEEHEVETNSSPYIFWGLNKYAEYNIWVSAVNQNGPGQSSQEIVVRTHSDVPSEMPQNVTLEAASSTSIILRWEPPPPESINGVITGYKIRYKHKGQRRGDTVTTDGNRRLYALSSLERGAEYNIKIAALTVNGTGPFTEWLSIETYLDDLDESRVPDPPSSIKARPNSNSIIVMWTSPRNQNIMVRGYTIGWGVGLPDVYTKVLDGKQRYYTIENLQPSSEYVISLRAYNQMGDGQPIYETVKTRIHTTPEPPIPMVPPLGLKAIVLSSTTVTLYWSDSTLPKNQKITDNRYYTVRYTTYFTSNPRYRYVNSTDLNCMIYDLKPNTHYEFAVKVIKSRRESTWSLSVFNTTLEAAPSSPPRDLTAVVVENNPSSVILNWQPPKQPNGQVIGYMIFYSTDINHREKDWAFEEVVGDKMTKSINGLTLNTTYYFKIQAKNSKGYSPQSQIMTFRTGAYRLGVDLPLDDSAYIGRGSGSNNGTLYIIIACVCGVVVLSIVGVTIILCRRRRDYGGERKKGYLGKVTGKGKNDLKPPDLWIHHDRMELKDIGKSRNSETTMTVSPLPRNSQDLDLDEKIHRDSLEKRGPTYIDDIGKSEKVSLLTRVTKPKPISLPLEIQHPPEPIATATPIPNGSLSQHNDRDLQSGSRPIYPRTQYNIPRAHVAMDSGCGGNSGNLTH
ncbi:hypothetical protein CHUAL_010299 [Chamberlinius hualienensis]